MAHRATPLGLSSLPSSAAAAAAAAAVPFQHMSSQTGGKENSSSSSIAFTPLRPTKRLPSTPKTNKSTKKRKTVFSVKKKAKLTPPRPRTETKPKAGTAAARTTMAVRRSARKRRPGTAKKANKASISSVPSSSAAATNAGSSRDEYVLRTSEHDPSPFQVQLPSRDETLVVARICHVMDTYMELAGNVDFDFNDLINAHLVVDNGSGSGSGSGSGNGNATIPDANNTTNGRDVVLAALKSIVPDVRVEGFFREYYSPDEVGGNAQRIEACIFHSPLLRQMWVCYRGGTAAQSRPIGVAAAEEHPVPFHVKHPGATVQPTFRAAYLAGDLEEQVFGVLNRLAAMHPFSDVVMTGTSFGAAVATLGATRYATLCPQIRVSATVFGSPKVGGTEFADMVHSLPNLRIMRIELVEAGRDVYACLPEGGRWRHAGHSIRIAPSAAENAPSLSTALIETMVGGGLSSSSSNRSERSENDDSSSDSDASTASRPSSRVVAYRFDQGKPGPSGFVAQGIAELSRIVMRPAACLGVGQGKAPTASSYIEQMESLEADAGWVSEFAGLVGNGVKRGLDNEVRLMV